MSVLQVEKPAWMTEDVEIFADAVGKFCEKEVEPHIEAREKQEVVDRDVWL